MSRIVVVGGGIFGLTAADELTGRGWDVTVIERGTVPDPLAASTDISKVIRMEYGADREYMALGEKAIEGWHRWNDMFADAFGEVVYHETGVAMFCMESMRGGGFEHESYQSLLARGHEPERATREVVSRFPAWNANVFVDGFYHQRGGFAESGKVVTFLAKLLRNRGVEFRESTRAVGVVARDGRAVGVRLADGTTCEADAVLIAAGAWTEKLIPELRGFVSGTGHPVFHLKPSRPGLFQADVFPTFTADVARTGYYGFPLSSEGVVKIGVHALGTPTDADGERTVTEDQVQRLRSFLEHTFPDLATDPIVYTRLCLYADTPDEHFLVARHPTLDGLTIASGGSGHGFKFAPVLGDLIADAVEGTRRDLSDRFGWRVGQQLEEGREAARCHDF